MTANDLESQIKTFDKINLYRRNWLAQGQEIGKIALVHGLGEHSGRYDQVSTFLNKRGYSLYSFDLRGHGKSEGKRGDTPDFNAFINDLDVFLASIPNFWDTPHFLYGHSLGAILVTAYELKRKPDLTGLICSGIALHNALEGQTLKLTMVRTLGNLLPHVTLASGLDPRMLSRDPLVVKNYTDDPLVHDRTSLGFASEMLKTITWIWENGKDIRSPMLLMHGGEDRLAYPSSSTELAQLIQSDRTVKIWDGLYHEIHNEPEKEQVLEFLVEWINNRHALHPSQ